MYRVKEEMRRKIIFMQAHGSSILFSSSAYVLVGRIQKQKTRSNLGRPGMLSVESQFLHYSFAFIVFFWLVFGRQQQEKDTG